MGVSPESYTFMTMGRLRGVDGLLLMDLRNESLYNDIYLDIYFSIWEVLVYGYGKNI